MSDHGESEVRAAALAAADRSNAREGLPPPSELALSLGARYAAGEIAADDYVHILAEHHRARSRPLQCDINPSPGIAMSSIDDVLNSDDPERIRHLIVDLLWDSSSSSIPRIADVVHWIDVLSRRRDARVPAILTAIDECVRYVRPYAEGKTYESVWGTIFETPGDATTFRLMSELAQLIEEEIVSWQLDHAAAAAKLNISEARLTELRTHPLSLFSLIELIHLAADAELTPSFFDQRFAWQPDPEDDFVLDSPPVER